VKHPYAENVLLPQGLAAPATPQVLEEIAAKVAAAEAARAAAVAEAKQKEAKLVATFGASGCFIEKKVGPDGGIFGSVTAAELADLLANQAGVSVDKKDVSMPEISPENDLVLPPQKPGQPSVKVAGTAVADIKLHPEVVSKLKVNVIPEA
jgi:large subunit ribosomal protein L9